MFSFNGTSYQFVNGEFITDVPELVQFLKDNHGCSLIEEPARASQPEQAPIELPKKPKKVSK